MSKVNKSLREGVLSDFDFFFNSLRNKILSNLSYGGELTNIAELAVRLTIVVHDRLEIMDDNSNLNSHLVTWVANGTLGGENDGNDQ